MIHSMSGGVLSDGEIYFFAKVRLEERVGWYLAPRGVKAGDRVIVPFGEKSCEGVVERTESCTAQTAPISPRRAREIERVING